MAGDKLTNIPFPVESYKEYLNSTDPELKRAAQYVDRLRKSGQLNAQFRTTEKFDKAQAKGKAQTEAARAGVVTTGAATVQAPTSPYAGTVIAEMGKKAQEQKRISEDKRVKLEQQRNAEAIQEGRPAPFPERLRGDQKVSGTTKPTPSTPVPQTSILPDRYDPWNAVRAGVEFDPATGITTARETGEQVFISVNNDKTTQVIPITTFRQSLRNMSNADRKALQKRLVQVYGKAYDGPTDGRNDVLNGKFEAAAVTLMQTASSINYDRYNFKQRPATLDDLIGDMGDSLRAGSTTTNISTTDFTPEEAKTILDAFYEESIGRRATADEVAKFTQVLKKQAKSRPTVTTSTTVGSTTRTSTKAGFGQTEAQALAQQEAEATTEYKPFQLATRAYDAFDKAIANMMIR